MEFKEAYRRAGVEWAEELGELPDHLCAVLQLGATVDAEVSIDQNGNITEIDIVRWAGYGLDESVANAVRSMNWRPAERDGKPLPMRILLRYNFTKTEKTLP